MMQVVYCLLTFMLALKGLNCLLPEECYQPYYYQTFNVQENTPVGSSIGKLVINCPGYQAISFEVPLISDYTVHPTTGEVFVKNPSDYENRRSDSFYVYADFVVEDYEMTAVISVNIIVEDVNDNAPRFRNSFPLSFNGTSYNKTEAPEVRANADPKEIVLVFEVKDMDSGNAGEVDCKIDNSKFQVINDVLVMTAVKFDEIPGAVENFKITCTDRGTPPLSVTKEFAVSVVGPKHEQRITRDEVALLKRLLKRSWKK